MSQTNGLNKVRSAIMFTIIVNLFYGVAFFLTPGLLSEIAGGTPVEHGWIRWSGGALLALAVGGIQAYRDPVNQRSMITTLTVAPLLVGLGLLHPLLFETYSIHTWFIVVPCAISFAMFGAMLWARQGAKDILAHP